MTDDRLDRWAKGMATAAPRRRFLAGVAAGLVAAIGLAPKETMARRCRSGRYSERRIRRYIKRAARRYNQSESAMLRVARCESNLDPCAVNSRGPYYGLYQFLESTWRTTPYRRDDIFDPKPQALAAAWMWKQGRKNEWACQ